MSSSPSLALLFFGGPLLAIVAAIASRASGYVDGAPTVEKRVLRYLPEARVAADAEGVPLPLVLAVASAESGGRPGARSRAEAVGLMQLVPSTALELAERAGEPRPDLTDPGTSLRLGARYLGQQLERFSGRPCGRQLALCAYNAGPARVERWLREAPLRPQRTELGRWIRFRETRDYVARVARFESRYVALAGR